VRQRRAPVGDQFAHQDPIDIVEVLGVGHGRRLSQERPSMTADHLDLYALYRARAQQSQEISV
jgi:hypothetical protein